MTRAERSTERVLAHLKDSGFGGHVTVTTEIADGRAVSTVQRGGRSVPWTAHLHNWLRLDLARLPGARVHSTALQSITVTWDG